MGMSAQSSDHREPEGARRAVVMSKRAKRIPFMPLRVSGREVRHRTAALQVTQLRSLDRWAVAEQRHTGSMRSLRAPTLAVVAVALGASSLAGCTPAREPILGLAVRDGRPVAVLVPCSERSTVSVYASDGPSADPDVSWTARSTASTAVTELVLLEAPPPGWEGGASAATLRPGVRYDLDGSSEVRAQVVSFTTADLERIAENQVLTRDGDDTRVVARSDFETEARESCP